MSSNIRLIRICEQCGKQFEAKKTTTKTCSGNCAKRLYKVRQRTTKVENSNEETHQRLIRPIEELKQQDFLTVDEAAKLVRISRSTLYRLIERRELFVTKLSRRTIISRLDINKLFEQPTSQEKNVVLQSTPLDECYTMKEIQEKYGISEKALNMLIKRNNLPKHYKGIYAYVPKLLIDRILS